MWGLSNLYLNYGCIPFERMPYCTSLRQHNPKIYDLFESIPVSGHEHELFARYIKNNTEIEGHLFTPKAEIEGFEDIDGLIRKYNSSCTTNIPDVKLKNIRIIFTSKAMSKIVPK